jgi:hypothetical protein
MTQSLASAFRAMCVEIESLPEAEASAVRALVARLLNLLACSIRTGRAVR